jgi:hypothetical protein
MSDSDEKDLLKGTWWFPLRRYLPGWGLPVCWQGWVVLGVYFILLVGPAPLLHGHFTAYFLGYEFLLTLGFLAVVVAKGEPIR